MQLPVGIAGDWTLEPLVIYRYAIHPLGNNEPFFSHPGPPSCSFSRVWFFSMSSYLRTLDDEVLDLQMPNAVARLRWLQRLTEILD